MEIIQSTATQGWWPVFVSQMHVVQAALAAFLYVQLPIQTMNSGGASSSSDPEFVAWWKLGLCRLSLATCSWAVCWPSRVAHRGRLRPSPSDRDRAIWTCRMHRAADSDLTPPVACWQAHPWLR